MRYDDYKLESYEDEINRFGCLNPEYSFTCDYCRNKIEEDHNQFSFIAFFDSYLKVDEKYQSIDICTECEELIISNKTKLSPYKLNVAIGLHANEELTDKTIVQIFHGSKYEPLVKEFLDIE